MRVTALAIVALSCGSAANAAGDAGDAALQGFVEDVRNGVDFSAPEFSKVISPVSAEGLKAFKDCGLGRVVRLEGLPTAGIYWDCPGGSSSPRPGAMVTLENGKIKSIVVPIYVPAGSAR